MGRFAKRRSKVRGCCLKERRKNRTPKLWTKRGGNWSEDTSDGCSRKVRGICSDNTRKSGKTSRESVGGGRSWENRRESRFAKRGSKVRGCCPEEGRKNRSP